jgi:hypothetical protein
MFQALKTAYATITEDKGLKELKKDFREKVRMNKKMNTTVESNSSTSAGTFAMEGIILNNDRAESFQGRGFSIMEENPMHNRSRSSANDSISLHLPSNMKQALI